jgi:hypothetical protein
MGILRPELETEIVESDVSYPVGTAGTVAIIGNFEKAEPGEIYHFNTTRQALKVLGDNTSYSGTGVIMQVFKKAESINSGGATDVLIYQLGSREKAELTLSTSLKLVAKISGKYGNDINITVVVNGTDDYSVFISYKNEIKEIYENLSLNTLVQKINNNSQYVTAEQLEENGSLTAVSNTSLSGGTESSTFTIDHLTTALETLKKEKFDYFISSELLNPTTAYPIIAEWVTQKFKMDKPTKAGLPLTGTIIENINIISNANEKHLIYLPQIYNDMSPAESTARYIGAAAGLKVGKSLTNKIIEDIDKISPEYTIDDGNILMAAGATILEQKDRLNNKYGVVSAVTAEHETDENGDLKIYSEQYLVNILDYLIYHFNLEKWLGDTEISANLETANAELSNRKKPLIDDKIVQDVNVLASMDDEEPFQMNVDFDAKANKIVKKIMKRIKISL